jgi:hypothetical protein
MNLRVPHNAGKFLSCCTIDGFSRWTQLHEWVTPYVPTLKTRKFCRMLFLTMDKIKEFCEAIVLSCSPCIKMYSESESYVTTDGQSASLSWNKAPFWGLRPDLDYSQTVAGFLMWGVHSDDRTCLSFAIAAGSRQRNHSWVRVPWNTRPYVSHSRLPFRRLLRLAGLLWRYSTPPSHGINVFCRYSVNSCFLPRTEERTFEHIMKLIVSYNKHVRKLGLLRKWWKYVRKMLNFARYCRVNSEVRAETCWDIASEPLI